MAKEKEPKLKPAEAAAVTVEAEPSPTVPAAEESSVVSTEAGERHEEDRGEEIREERLMPDMEESSIGTIPRVEPEPEIFTRVDPPAEEHKIEEEVKVEPAVPEHKEGDPNKVEPVVGEQPITTPKIFPTYAYNSDSEGTKSPSLQDEIMMKQNVHYLAQSIELKRKFREENDMSKSDENIMYYGTFSLDWTDVRHREIGKTIPEIAYLNYWAPQRVIMLNVEWLPRLVKDGYILKDLTPGTWNGYINEKNVAKYLKKVQYLLKKGKIRP